MVKTSIVPFAAMAAGVFLMRLVAIFVTGVGRVEFLSNADGYARGLALRAPSMSDGGHDPRLLDGVGWHYVRPWE